MSELFSSPEEYVRAWTIQLALEDASAPHADAALLLRLSDLAATDPSPVVRLALASGLQRLPMADRLGIAEGLVRHGEDSSDANLPLRSGMGLSRSLTDDDGCGCCSARKFGCQFIAHGWRSAFPSTDW